MKYSGLSLMFFFVSHSIVFSQDQTNFTQFYINPFLINSSYAGIDGKSSFSLVYRNQWTQIKDAPRIANFSLHTPINRKLSTGLSATNDTRGILSNTALLITFGYNFFIAEDAHLRFGISAGGSWNSVDFQKLETINDPAMGKLLENNASVTGNAGVSIHRKTFHGGISLPVLFTPAFVSTNSFTVTEVKPFQSIIVHACNRFYFNNNKNVFEPYAVYRINTGLPTQFELASIIHMNHAVWVGGSFKQDFGISAIGGVKLKNALAIGASYSLQNTGTNELNSPTMEISLGLLLGAYKKEAPVYSFINTVKEKKKKFKSASDAVAEKRAEQEAAKQKQQEQLAQNKKLEEQKKTQAQKVNAQSSQAKNSQVHANQKQKAVNNVADKKSTSISTTAAQKKEPTPIQNKSDAINQKNNGNTVADKKKDGRTEKEKNEQLAIETDKTVDDSRTVAKSKEAKEMSTAEVETPEGGKTKIDTVRVMHKARFANTEAVFEIMNVEVTEHSPQDEQERLSRLNLHKQNPTESIDNAKSPNGERHQFAGKSSHPKELQAADYVVSGEFAEEANAKKFAEGLRKLGFTDTKYGYLSEKKHWYVYISKADDIHQAKSSRDKYRKMKIFRDAWLLTVQ